MSFKGFLGIILIIIISLILINKYYGFPFIPKAEKENPRFVKIDFEDLKKSAELIPKNIETEGNAKNVFVLTYHVISKGEPEDSYTISYDQFKENMFTLKSNGYQTIRLSDFYAFMRGEKEIPDKSFIITFDDGAKASFYNADPLLEVLNYTAVMFVIAGHSIDGNYSAYYLNESELKKVGETGRWEIESHTYESHFRLPSDSSGNFAPALTNKLWLSDSNRMETDEEFYNRIYSDLSKANLLLESHLNRTITSFALPYGDFGERGSNYPEAHTIVQNITSEMYKMIFYEFPLKTRLFRGNYPERPKQSYLIVRIAADSIRTPENLLKRIQASRQIELPYNEDYTNEDRWIRVSGSASYTKESISIFKLEDKPSNSLFAYLDGSMLWKDYQYDVTIKNTNARKISLISRLTVDQNYVMCTYSPGFIRISTYIGDVQVQSAQKPYPVEVNNDLVLNMKVIGSIVICGINGTDIYQEQLAYVPDYGGVGIRGDGFSDPNPKIVFSNVSISEIKQLT